MKTMYEEMAETLKVMLELNQKMIDLLKDERIEWPLLNTEDHE
jgi:hypothetical protein